MLCPHSSHGLWCGERLVSHPKQKGGGVIKQIAPSNGFDPEVKEGLKGFGLDPILVRPESEAVFGLGFSKANTLLLHPSPVEEP